MIDAWIDEIDAETHTGVSTGTRDDTHTNVPLVRCTNGLSMSAFASL